MIEIPGGRDVQQGISRRPEFGFRRKVMISFEEFRDRWALDVERICRDVFKENRTSISVKKEKVAVKNIMKILDAVFSLSRKKGFQAMTMRDLCGESGLSMGALYSYFSGKGEIRSTINRQGVTYVKEIILENIRPYENPTEKLTAAIETHLYMSEILRSWFYFSYMEAGSLMLEEKLEAMESELAIERIFMGIIENGVENGDFIQTDIELTAAIIKAMMQDWYLKRWKYKRRDITVQEYARFIVNFVLTSIATKKSKENQ